MDMLLNVDWLAIIVGTIVAFGAGAIWYSPKMFGAKWASGVGLPMEGKEDMTLGMIAQFVSTFLLAWVIGVTAEQGALGLAILVGLAVAATVKANGVWKKISNYAIMTESLFILVMVAIMIIVHALI